MTISTRSLASASARHPWRTLGAWIAATLLALVAVATLLGGSLTSEGGPTNDSESERADAAGLRAFPPDPARTVTDIVVIRSAAHSVDSPAFEAFVRSFVEDDEIPVFATAPTYLDGEAGA